jgi:hypothetical protein
MKDHALMDMDTYELVEKLYAAGWRAHDIEKHLIGSHDQKKHGKKGHTRFEHSTLGFSPSYRGIRGAISDTKIAGQLRDTRGSIADRLAAAGFERDGELSNQEKAAIAVGLTAAAGIVGPRMFRTVAPIKPATKGLKGYDMDWFRNNKDYHKGVHKWVEGGSASFRQFLEGKTSYYDPSWETFADGLDNLSQKGYKPMLFRGAVLPKTTKGLKDIPGFTLSADQLTTGHQFDMTPSSFSKSRLIAAGFTAGGSAKHGEVPVIFRLKRGSNAANIANTSPLFPEREFIGWGKFEVGKVRTFGKHTVVDIKQVESYSLLETFRSAPKIHPPRTAPKMYTDIQDKIKAVEQLFGQDSPLVSVLSDV